MSLSSPFQTYEITLPEDHPEARLDKVLAQWGKESHLSRTRLQSLIEKGFVKVNHSLQQHPSFPVRGGDQLTVEIPPLEDPLPLPQPIPLSIVYEDEEILVLDKPAGLVVHPGAGNPDQTLVNGLLFHCGDHLSGISGVRRPGIVHRLDKGTSGLMVVAKSDRAHQGLAAQFEERQLSRIYQAVVWGWPSPPQGTLTGSLGRHPHHRQKMAVLPPSASSGKTALTHYRLLHTGFRETVKVSLVECVLGTGRTHQIRVHLSHEGYPLVGDPLYGKPPKGIPPLLRGWLESAGWMSDRQALHAAHLKFIHPLTQEFLSFTSPFPEDMTQLICYFNINKK